MVLSKLVLKVMSTGFSSFFGFGVRLMSISMVTCMLGFDLMFRDKAMEELVGSMLVRPGCLTRLCLRMTGWT